MQATLLSIRSATTTLSQHINHSRVIPLALLRIILVPSARFGYPIDHPKQ